MSGKVEVLNGGGPIESVNPGLSWVLSPTIGGAASIIGHPLNGERSGICLDDDAIPEMGDQVRSIVQELPG